MKTAVVSFTRFLLAVVLGAIALSMSGQTDPVPFPTSGDNDPTAHGPKLISRIDATYPVQLIAQRVEEDVYVAFVVDPKGDPIKVRAFFSHRAEFERPAEEAVRQWKFTPGACGSRAVHTQMVVAIHFSPPPAKT